MLKDIIEISKGFQSSVNIEYDFNDKNKITGFIPTCSALEIICNIISNTDNDLLERAKILTGAYGRGKSHIVLVALSILFNKNKSLFETLLKKIERIDENAYKIIKNYITSNKKLLPVIINGNSGNLTQAFLNALQKALKVYDLEDLMPETHFQAAINKIYNWKSDYPNTYELFQKKINKDVDLFIKELKNNKIESYQRFVSIYPELTAGSTFNPFVGFNVVDIYDNVNISLKTKGYSGMFVVYDEFGKYLESSMITASESDTKMLQDFAEKCNRPASQQLHLLLICHKDISNYIDSNLSKDKVDGWRGISGRFEHTNLSNNFSQMYEIIADAIIKKDAYKSFVCENKQRFEDLIEIYKKNGFLSGKEESVVYDCYPLHPTTTFILPRLSEKIAQNERTLFTFLTATQKNTLREFVKKDESKFTLVTPDYLYNYFENELKKELNSSEIHHIYTLSAKILQSISDELLSTKIIKVIAVIYFIQQFENIAPTTDVICDIFSFCYDRKTILDEIESLITKSFIVYKKKSNNFLCLKESSGIDVSLEIKNRADKIKNIKSISEVINQYSKTMYLYPNQHNDRFCITRYFDFKFVSGNELEVKLKNEIPENIAGRVYAVFYDNPVDFEQERFDNSFYTERSIMIFPKVYCDISSVAYEYAAVQELIQECNAEDAVLMEEYRMYSDDYYAIIDDFIMGYTRPELDKSEYYISQEKLQIKRKSQLSNALSQICDEIYSLTPIINNESLNKDILPSVAINSRTRLINAILDCNTIEGNLGLVGSGQEVSFMRSALIQTGVLVNKDGNYQFDLNNNTGKNVDNVLTVIKEFFNSTISNGEQSFCDLYNKLISYKYSIGIKKGVIPIYLAVVLKSIKDNVVIMCNGSETKLSADLLNAINEKPECYSVVLDDWDDEKKTYLNELKLIFKDYLKESDKQFNMFAYIFNAIEKWYFSLPKCARESKIDYSTGSKISKQKLKFIGSLKKQITNYRKYIMEELPEIFSVASINDTITDAICKTKAIYDSQKYALTKCIIADTNVAFGGSNKSSLKSSLLEWYESLKEQTIQNMFSGNENSLLSQIANITNDEVTFIERFSKNLIGLRIDDWDSMTFGMYKKSLESFISKINEFNQSSDEQNEHTGTRYSIGFIDQTGKEVKKSFEKVEYSSRAKLLYNDITGAIEDMGQSITENEKRQVLIEILEKLCK